MKKELILEKIEKLFYKKSFKDVSLQKIAETLDIKKSSLYYYFPSKDKLLDELIDFSFTNYKNDLNSLLKKELLFFIKEFVFYPQKTKNIFSLINQTWYCDNYLIKEKIKLKNKQLFLIISESFKKNYAFDEKKTFLLLNLLESLAKKDCLLWQCDFDENEIFNEIIKLFIS